MGSWTRKAYDNSQQSQSRTNAPLCAVFTNAQVSKLWACKIIKQLTNWRQIISGKTVYVGPSITILKTGALKDLSLTDKSKSKDRLWEGKEHKVKLIDTDCGLRLVKMNV